VPEEVAGAGVAEVIADNPNARKQRNAVLIGLGAVVFVFLWFGYYRPAPAEQPVEAKAVLPVSSAKSSPPAPPTKNVLAEVVISELHAALTEQGGVMASFVITNNGGANNDYPSLRIHWKDSAAPDTVMNNKSYAHPEDAFTKVAVSTELVKPADATGVEINLQY
jgi:hypothetical protein